MWWLLRLLPVGSLVTSVLPALGGVASAVGSIIAIIGKVIAEYIEACLLVLHHPRTLLVVASAFGYGLLYSKDVAVPQILKPAPKCECKAAPKPKPAIWRHK